MSKSNKHKATSAKDFSNYRDGRLNKKQQHALEKKLLEDDFESEAFEGMENVSAEELTSDLAELSGRISRRKESSRNYWMAAAVVATLISATVALFYFVDLKEQPEIVQEISVQGDHSDQEPTASSTEKDTIARTEEDTPSGLIAENKKDKEAIKPESTPSQSEQSEVLALAKPMEEEPSDEDITNEGGAGESRGIESVPSAKSRNTSGLSSSDGIKETQLEPIPETGDLNRVATSEVLPSDDDRINEEEFEIPSSIAYDEGMEEVPTATESDVNSIAKAAGKRQRQAEEKSKRSERSMALMQDYSEERLQAPFPSTGMDNFISYLKENLSFVPEDSTLHITLVVRTNGEIEELTFQEKLSRKEKSELDKLIKDGPEWIPASMNGTFVSQKAEISIIW